MSETFDRIARLSGSCAPVLGAMSQISTTCLTDNVINMQDRLKEIPDHAVVKPDISEVTNMTSLGEKLPLHEVIRACKPG